MALDLGLDRFQEHLDKFAQAAARVPDGHDPADRDPGAR